MIRTSNIDLSLISTCLQQARLALAPISETPGLDAQVLLSEILQKPKTWVIAHSESRLDESQQVIFRQAIDRLIIGKPLPYVLGHWEFYGLDFIVTPDVLIPRPETELLVEAAIQSLSSSVQKDNGHFRIKSNDLRVVDVGTGSGIISICMAKVFPGIPFLAVDRSAAALRIARQNAQMHKVEKQITFFQGNLLSAIKGKIDLVVANLPYIPSTTLVKLPVFQQEPRLALDGGPDGLLSFRRLLSDANRFIAPGGSILLEMEANRGSDLRKLVNQFMPEAKVSITPDLHGFERLLCITV